jgi:hypothetical protein
MCLSVIGLLALTARAQNFTFSTFDVPGADSTELHGINRHMIGPIRSQSTVIGTYHDIGGTHAFSLGPGGLITLPDPPNSASAGQCAYCKDTEGFGISNTGVIVGTYLTARDTKQPFRFLSGTLTDPGFECGYATEVYGVNDQGTIVGACQSLDLYSDGTPGIGNGFYVTPSLKLTIGPGFLGPSRGDTP